MQLIREHLATVVSAHRATVDWSWPKKLNLWAWADLHLKKKAQVGNEWLITLQKSSQARKSHHHHCHHLHHHHLTIIHSLLQVRMATNWKKYYLVHTLKVVGLHSTRYKITWFISFIVCLCKITICCLKKRSSKKICTLFRIVFFSLFLRNFIQPFICLGSKLSWFFLDNWTIQCVTALQYAYTCCSSSSLS